MDPNLIRSLTMMLQESNPLIQLYLTARERLTEIREAESNCRLIIYVLNSGSLGARSNLIQMS